MRGQCNVSIAPVIYHFPILYISFANLKNFSFLRLHQHSRFIKSGQSVCFAIRNTHPRLNLEKKSIYHMLYFDHRPLKMNLEYTLLHLSSHLRYNNGIQITNKFRQLKIYSRYHQATLPVDSLE